MNRIANTDYEATIIQTLRQDAKDLKDCYTRFSFQSIAFASAVLGIIARYQPDYPHTALASVAIILLLATVARIGTYKYGSANRHYGYELHLFRTRNLEDSPSDGWKSSMRAIGWEEAMRAWRVVQATIFHHLYFSHRLTPNYLRWKYRNAEYKWFDPKELAVPTAAYHAGSYLRVMNTVLHSLAALATIPLVFMTYQLYDPDTPIWKWAAVVPVASILFIIFRFTKDSARRRVLETGLLSIHSCAIMWQAVVVAHYRAINSANQAGNEGFKHYTEYLSTQARDLALNIFRIHEWVQGTQETADSCQVETPVPN